MATFRARPLLLGRHCIGLVVLVILALGGAAAGIAAQPTAADPLDRINGARERHRAAPVAAHAGLDDLARRYLDGILAERELSPAVYREPGARALSEDVAAAIGEEGYGYRYVGVVVTYGHDPRHAMDIGIGSAANGPALLEPAMEYAGIALAEIPAGPPWFAPPPGGFGRDVELTGQTVVVIVTAGAFRART